MSGWVRQKADRNIQAARKASGNLADYPRKAVKMQSKNPAGAFIDEKEAAEDPGDILRCRCHSMRVSLYRQGRLQRQKRNEKYGMPAGPSRKKILFNNPKIQENIWQPGFSDHIDLNWAMFKSAADTRKRSLNYGQPCKTSADKMDATNFILIQSPATRRYFVGIPVFCEPSL